MILGSGLPSHAIHGTGVQPLVLEFVVNNVQSPE